MDVSPSQIRIITWFSCGQDSTQKKGLCNAAGNIFVTTNRSSINRHSFLSRDEVKNISRHGAPSF